MPLESRVLQEGLARLALEERKVQQGRKEKWVSRAIQENRVTLDCKVLLECVDVMEMTGLLVPPANLEKRGPQENRDQSVFREHVGYQESRATGENKVAKEKKEIPANWEKREAMVNLDETATMGERDSKVHQAQVDGRECLEQLDGKV